MKIKRFSFFIGNNHSGMPTYHKQDKFVSKQPVFVLKAGCFSFCNTKQRRYKSQAMLEYFILFSVFSLICLLSMGEIFRQVQSRAESFYNEKAATMNLGAR